MGAPRFTPYAGDRYLNFAEVEAWLHAAVAALPRWASLQRIGDSLQGRPIWLLTIGDHQDHPERKPTFWMDGATHAAEWTGVMACVYTASRWLAALSEGDAATLANFQATTAVIVPVISPDGFHALCEGEPFLRSTLRPPVPGTLRTGLSPRDMDGDGCVRKMRWKHPSGPWIDDPAHPHAMRPRTLDDDPEDAWILCDEGELLRWDGVSWVFAAREHGVDLNRNFPGHWEPFQMFGMHGGAYTLSEPESRAVVDAFAARPTVGAALTCHTYTGCLLTQPYRDPSPLGTLDVELMERMGKLCVDGTGYRVIRTHPDFVYDPKRAIVGVWADTISTTFGVPGYTLELWDPYAYCGLKLEKPAEAFVKPDAGMIQQMISRFAEDPGANLPWTPFEHPQLGPVEVGGLDYMRTIRNPPVAKLAEECDKGYRIAERMRRALPRLGVQLQSAAVGAETHVLTAIFENLGFLSTVGLERAAAIGLDPGTLVSLALEGSVRCVEGELERNLGHLDGWGLQLVTNARHGVYADVPARGHRAPLRWVLVGRGQVHLRWKGRLTGDGEATIEVG